MSEAADTNGDGAISEEDTKCQFYSELVGDLHREIQLTGVTYLAKQPSRCDAQEWSRVASSGRCQRLLQRQLRDQGGLILHTAFSAS